MSDSTEILQAYLNRMLTIQQNRSEKPLTPAELKEMALDSGMTEEDWAAAQQESKVKMKSGLGHLQYGNWEKSLADLEQAIAVNPYHADGLVGLAKAYLLKYQTSKVPADKQKAENYVERALEVSPGYNSALSVAKQLRDAETTVADTKKNQKLIQIGIAVGIVVFVLISGWITNSSIASQETKVAKLWTQVEADFTRRSNLVSDIVKILNENPEIEDAKSLKKELEKAARNTKNLHLEVSELSENKLGDFVSKQEDLSVEAKQAITNIESFAQKNPEKYRNVLNKVDEYKSNVNRAFVSTKKYNEGIINYNSSISSFPKNLFSKPKKATVRLITR
jgi:LemA protein